MTLIDFDDLDVGTPVANYYYSRGVTVDSGRIDNADGIAHSGTRYLRGPSNEFQGSAPVTFTFHPWGATQVQLYAGSLATFTVLAHLQARNFKGEIVDMSGPKILGGGDLQVARACQTLFKVSGPAIASVTLTALGVDESKAVVQPIQVIDDLEFEPAKLIAGPPAHRPEIIHVPWFEHGVDSLILAGIRLGEGGVWLGPHGEPHPVPPIRPEERAILAAFVANGVAEMISDAESRRAIQRAALGVIAREAHQMSERL